MSEPIDATNADAVARVGWCIADIKRSRRDLILRIVSPSTCDDGVHQPDQSVILVGNVAVFGLRDFLNAHVVADDEESPAAVKQQRDDLSLRDIELWERLLTAVHGDASYGRLKIVEAVESLLLDGR